MAKGELEAGRKMSHFEKRLNMLAGRLVEQAGYIQFLTDPVISSSQEDSPISDWRDPVTLPSSEQAREILRSSERSEAKGALRDLKPSGTRRTPVLLATHFLEDWYEWQVLSYRFAYFFGKEVSDVLPGPSARLKESVSEQVDVLAASEEFLEALRASAPTGAEQYLAGDLLADLQEVGSGETENDAENPDRKDVKDVVSSVARFGEYDRFLRGLSGKTRQHDQRPEWLHTLVLNLDRVEEALIDLVLGLMRKSDAAATQLRAYRYSSLSLSWLISRNEKVFADLFGGHLPFISRLYRRIDQAEEKQRTVASTRAEESQAKSVLRRVARTVEEIGLDHFVQSIENHDFYRGKNTLFAGQSAQIITSREEAASDNHIDADICVGLAISDDFYPGPPSNRNTRREKRRSKRLEQRLLDLDQVLKQVKEWIAEYGPDGKTVLIITDLWAPEEFADRHAQIFEAWGNRGAEVFVTVPNHNGTSLSVVDSNFE